MKKFFSLVLALVMALSLTTVAWGVDVDSTNAQSTLHAAGEDLVLNLTGDVTSKLVVDWRTTDEGYADATQGEGVGYLVYPMKRTMGDLTIQGNGTTKFAGLTFISGLTNFDGVSGAGGDHVTGDACYDIDTLKFSNVKITDKIDLATGGSNRALIDNLVFENVTFDVASDICVYVGDHIKNVTFTKCTFNAVSKAAIEVTGAGATDINVTVDNCTFDGPARGILLSSGSYTGDITITNNKIATNGERAVRITSLDAGATVTMTGNTAYENGSMVDGDDEILKINTVASGATVTVTNIPAGAVVNVADAVTLTGDFTGMTMDGSNKITAGTFTDDVSDYVADGKQLLANGTVVTTPAASATDPVLYVWDKAATDWATYYIATGADLDDLKQDASDNCLPCYLIDGEYFVETAEAAATYKLVYGAKTVYLAPVPASKVCYSYKASVLTVVAEDDAECGDFWVADATYDEDDVYYISYDKKGDIDGIWVKAKNGSEQILVNGKIVDAEVAGYVGFMFHEWKGNDIVNYQYTTVKCENCDKVAKLYATATAAGKKAQPVGNGIAGYITYADYTDFGAVSAPSTDKTVQSAETFDAGIAMYVGMSVMAAAGSAVVIGKKKH